jgi:SulP family sulfate permease
VPEVAPRVLWNELRGATPPVVVDVREPREFKTGHIPGARLLPFTKLLTEKASLPDLRTVVLVCRGGRRSARACAMLRAEGYRNVIVLRGGMQAWEAAALLEAFDEPQSEEALDEAAHIP